MPPIILSRIIYILTHCPTITIPHPPMQILSARNWPPTSSPIPHSITGSPLFPAPPVPFQKQLLVVLKWFGIGFGGALVLYIILAHIGLVVNPYIRRCWDYLFKGCCFCGDEEEYGPPHRPYYGIMARYPQNLLPGDTNPRLANNGEAGPNAVTNEGADDEDGGKSQMSNLSLGSAAASQPIPIPYRSILVRTPSIPDDNPSSRPKRFTFFDRVMWPRLLKQRKQTVTAPIPSTRPTPPARRVASFDGVSDGEETQLRMPSRSRRRGREGWSAGVSAVRSRYGMRRGRSMSVIQESSLPDSSYGAAKSMSESSADRTRRWAENVAMQGEREGFEEMEIME